MLQVAGKVQTPKADGTTERKASSYTAHKVIPLPTVEGVEWHIEVATAVSDPVIVSKRWNVKGGRYDYMRLNAALLNAIVEHFETIGTLWAPLLDETKAARQAQAEEKAKAAPAPKVTSPVVPAFDPATLGEIIAQSVAAALAAEKAKEAAEKEKEAAEKSARKK